MRHHTCHLLTGSVSLPTWNTRKLSAMRTTSVQLQLEKWQWWVTCWDISTLVIIKLLNLMLIKNNKDLPSYKYIYIIYIYTLAGYPASLGFPIMHPFHGICTHSVSIIAISSNYILHLPNNTLRHITIQRGKRGVQTQLYPRSHWKELVSQAMVANDQTLSAEKMKTDTRTHRQI